MNILKIIQYIVISTDVLTCKKEKEKSINNGLNT